MRLTQKLALYLCIIVVALTIFPFNWTSTPSRSAQAEGEAVWQVAAEIHGLFFEAQRELFASGRATDPTENYAAAADYIEQATALYQSGLQPDFQAMTPQADTAIQNALTAAQTAASAGDGGQLAWARGQVWTGLLWASYGGTLTALEADDAALASDWLRLREFRQATRLTLVADLAAQAITALENGNLQSDEALVKVRNDLNDTYFFRLRQSLNDLEDAAAKNYGTRAAEYTGQVSGYAAILRDDMTTKLGESSVNQIETTLYQLEQAVLTQTWSAVTENIAAVRALIADYQPVALNQAEVEERGRLLYLFLSLVHFEYNQGVRHGEITIPIEVQEATTFREQAQIIFEELRPVMAQNHPTETDQLATLLLDMEATMQAVGEPDELKTQMDAALKLVETTLDVKVDVNDTSSTFIVINTLLDDVVASVREGRYEDAERTRLEAYGMLEAGTEMLIMAFNPKLAAEIEGLFWHGTGDETGLAAALSDEADADEIAATRTVLGERLNEARIAIGAGSTDHNAIILNTATIVFREGLEAVVILAALMASMVADRKTQRRPMVVGVLMALIATAATWWLAQMVISSLARFGQRLEAVVSLIAVAVLMVITNWFFHKLYWTGWMARFHKHKKKLVSAEIGQFLGLMLLGFSSVYREGFETVLFLQALVLDAGTAVVLEGVALGLIGVAIVGVLTFKFQTRLPYKKMMIVTGALIVTVLFTMVGNTVHLMQAVGWLPITPISGLQVPYWLGLWFGVFPTWQGILIQVGAVAFVLGSYGIAEWLRHHKRSSVVTRKQQLASQ